MLQLTEMLSARPEPLWKLAKQCGVDDIVATMDGAEQDQRMFASIGEGGPSFRVDSPDAPWSERAIAHQQEVYADYGFGLSVIEDTPPLDLVRLGLPGRDEQIESFIIQVRAMGALGVSTLCYNWMAKTSWARTAVDIPTRGGALVTGFSRKDAERLGDVIEPGGVTADQLWSGFGYFLDAVLPEAEKAGVRLALHPDDPPAPVVRGMPRIMSSVDSYRRVLAHSASPSNAITLCQGNFAMMTDDLPGVIREFGSADRVAFVHFRDVVGTADDFVETFHDAGQTDLAACMQAYYDVGFSGPIRPDHVPTMAGESNERPGYATLGRLFALGYIRGLEDSISR
ncbi:MAG: Mannonate dehydratase [Microbacteriaceae bacterium]|jgi:mannonate dehydratase|nr:Mannonate dehydratase [Microbacteriaceae bacterium]